MKRASKNSYIPQNYLLGQDAAEDAREETIVSFGSQLKFSFLPLEHFMPTDVHYFTAKLLEKWLPT